jgi:hypothetical protein
MNLFWFVALFCTALLLHLADRGNVVSSGIHEMKCMVCPLKYVWQTGRMFYTRYKGNIKIIQDILRKATQTEKRH